MGNWLDKLLRVDERALKKIERSAFKVMAYEEEMRALTDEELQAKTPYFKELLANGYNHKESSVVNTYYAVSDTEVTPDDDGFIILVKHYEMSDGTWKTDNCTYKYRLEITGRMPNAVKDSTFVFLSNIEDISFQKAMMASGLSSNMEDYFDEETAKFVGMR